MGYTLYISNIFHPLQVQILPGILCMGFVICEFYFILKGTSKICLALIYYFTSIYYFFFFINLCFVNLIFHF